MIKLRRNIWRYKILLQLNPAKCGKYGTWCLHHIHFENIPKITFFNPLIHIFNLCIFNYTHAWILCINQHFMHLICSKNVTFSIYGIQMHIHIHHSKCVPLHISIIIFSKPFLAIIFSCCLQCHVACNDSVALKCVFINFCCTLRVFYYCALLCYALSNYQFYLHAQHVAVNKF